MSESESVVILTYSQKLNQKIAKSVESIALSLKYPCHCEAIAVENFDDPAAIESCRSEIDQCSATLLALEDRGLSNNNYRQAVDRCVRNAAKRDDYRLFVALSDYSIAELHQVAESGDTTAASLIENVQLDETPKLKHIIEILTDYLIHLPDTRRMNKWHNWSASVSRRLGSIAARLEVLLAVVTFLSASFEGWFGLHRILSHFSETQRGLFAMLISTMFFPCFFVIVFFVLNWRQCGKEYFRKRPVSLWWIGLCLFMMALSLKIPLTLGVETSWILLGFTVGALLDAARRAGRHSGSSINFLEKAYTKSTSPVSNRFLALLEQDTGLLPSDLPLLSRELSVFISYSRSSAWCNRIAGRLYKDFNEIGIRTFLDQTDIPKGVSWRKQLHSRIEHDEVFISILDHSAMKRKWVAAELLTALLRHFGVSFPKLVLLVKDDSRRGYPEDRLPIFNAVLAVAGSEHKLGAVQLRYIGDDADENLGQSILASLPQNQTVFPSAVSLVFLLAILPVVLLGTIGVPVLGILAILALPYQFFEIYDVISFFKPIVDSKAGLPLIGFLWGFGVRKIASSYYETERDASGFFHPFEIIPMIGLLIICGMLADSASLDIRLWAFVACVFGWLTGKLKTLDIIKSTFSSKNR